ncbi:polyphosphate polymerase domain-containing protein [Glycomyces sp. TRM65418]|uniref:polyphosphate polymerase domain-containing protein n=1 Tax=Glycomyces sp. TRM65418 TaxID=2867006 RepID=UPI001CE651C4|nr:polyphosphate polymerase domain-containing protein [Glycomyces sp. TRM65418]MCC3765915.1 polyphosphate polymerase domain-containing protein [Glycomyces sp. TRM65418]QZD55497.1 polyphosphate polymerase domain-containing protein [Glycomyces sp. TRM65418]
MSLGALQVFGGLTPVGLGELLAVAELQTRVDRKYLVSQEELAALAKDMGGELAVLEIQGVRRFAYESVYFDTPALSSYLGTARSRRRRFKVRTRTYLDSGQCMLEIKTRAGVATVKQRFDYAAVDRHRLTDEGRWRIEGTVQVPEGAAALEPVLVTRYRRVTALHVPSGARLTCDTELRFEDFTGREGAISPELAVVEVKSAGRSGPVDRRLWRAGYRPCPISKYGTGMAFLRPELPANKWNRTLRRHFGWRPASPPAAAQPGLSM